MLQFSYDQGSASTAAAAPVLLRLTFEPKAIQQLLQQHAIPVWGEPRPALIVWLAVEDPTGGRRLVGSTTGMAEVELLQRAARQRGVPLIIPRLDAFDSREVQLADIWGGFLDNIRTASKRYEARAILLGRVLRDGGQWRAEWTFIEGNEQRQWQQSSAASELLIASGIYRSGDELASRYQLSPGQTRQQLRVTIEAVNSFAQYLQLRDYIATLSGIDALALADVSAGTLTFSLTTAMPPQRIFQLLELDGRLRPVAATASGVAPLLLEAESAAVRYRFQPR
ncbi:MAG: DUF2066 domain-containing protein [Gammaproteobacteria bacterium]|nr:DUF2066 domain-containing protein [Gammaproteobacteria bacterium]